MADPPRMTRNVLKVLQELLEDPTAERHGLDIGRAAGLQGGSLYPVLGKLEDARLVTSRWEDTDPSQAGRPRRRFYKLSPQGVAYARQALAEARQDLAPRDEQAPGWGRAAGFPAPGGASA